MDPLNEFERCPKELGIMPPKNPRHNRFTKRALKLIVFDWRCLVGHTHRYQLELASVSSFENVPDPSLVIEHFPVEVELAV
jgi:hypothetical protein